MRLRVNKYTKWWPSPPEEPSNTIELLDFALAGGDSARELARKLDLGDNTLNVARHRGRLSPTAAGTLASHVGKDPVLWTAVAAMEAEPPSPQRDSLIEKITKTLAGKMRSHVL